MKIRDIVRYTLSIVIAIVLLSAVVKSVDDDCNEITHYCLQYR